MYDVDVYQAWQTPFAQGSLDEAGNADEWGIAPIPYTGDEPRQNLYGGSVMMPYGTPENQLASWIFIKWFVSPEAQADWVQASNYFSPRSSTAELLEDYISDNPKYADALELVPFAEFEPQLISYADVRNAVNDAFNEIITGDVTADDIPAKLAELDEFDDICDVVYFARTPSISTSEIIEITQMGRNAPL